MTEVICFLPSAIVDEVVRLNRAQLLSILGSHGGSEGGSMRLEEEQFKALLASLPTEEARCSSSAGGSAANTARALSSIFGIKTSILTARGDDSFGSIFLHSLEKAHVSTEKVKVMQGGATGRSLILTEVESGERTMRTYLDRERGTLQPEMIHPSDFEHAQWSHISLYSIYIPGLLMAALMAAKEAGSKVIVDLASKEIVTMHRETIIDIISQGLVDCLVCNQDEAMNLDLGSTPQEISSHLTSLSKSLTVIVTLGKEGCFASMGDEKVTQPAIEGIKVVDSSGCGDAFTAGVLFSLLNHFPLKRCCEIASYCGAAAIQQLGAELTLPSIRFIHEKMHSELAASSVESLQQPFQSLHRELLQAHSLVERIGRGVVVFGSARLGPSSPFYSLSVDLARDMSSLLKVPLWTGGGPGLMRAASEGALSIGGTVGGIKIGREAAGKSSSVLSADYLPPSSYIVCQHMPIRKSALTDAGVRVTESDRTAFVFLPGGLGTFDELFSLLTLIQLKKIDTRPIPIIALNYEGFFNGLMHMLESFGSYGVMEASEHSVYLASNNEEAIGYLKRFYNIES